MKTDEFISALVADRPSSGPLGRRLALWLAAGAAISFIAFMIVLGPRHDLAPALATWRFDFKVVLMVATLALAFDCCRTLARPVQPPHPARRLLLPLGAIGIAVGLELVKVPADLWAQRMIGTNSMICLTAIPLLSLAPLVAVLAMLRSGAPTSPGSAGAAAGLLSAACGASLYAFHCFDDSPLFVIVWYSLAALPVILIGALAGHRLLRW